MTRHWVLLLAVIHPIYFSLGLAAEYYVAPEGNDASLGTSSEPFATLSAARDAIRELKNTNNLPDGGVTVWIRGGRYLLQETFLLTPEDSGLADKPIVYAAYPGETPVISGGQIINGWQKFEGQRPDVTSPARGKLWVADVPKGWLFHCLFADGKRRTRAQRPNSDNLFDGSLPNILKWGPVDPKGQVLTFPDGALDHVPNNGDAEVWLPIMQYALQVAVLRDVNPATNTARRCSKMPTYHQPRTPGYGYIGYPFRIENALICLDVPGEWCVDSDAGRVYYWPPEGTMEGIEVIASRLVNLVRFQGDDPARKWVTHIQLKGLSFRHSDRIPEDQWPDSWIMRNFENPDAVIFLQGVEDCIIEGCTIADAGTYAVALDRYAQRNRIIGNEMGYLGCGGVQLNGYGVGTRDENQHNLIHRNYIHHTGIAGYFHAGGVIMFNSGHNTVTHNFVYSTPYAAMQMSGVIRGDWNRKRDPVQDGNYDSFGRYGAIYQFQWGELPPGWQEAWLAGKGTVGFWDWQKYAHTRNNYWAYNIVVEPETHCTEGGAFYSSDGVGSDNRWCKNLVYKSGNMRESSVFALDGPSFVRFIIDDNVVWADQEILLVADPRGLEEQGKPTGSKAINNVRATNGTRAQASYHSGAGVETGPGPFVSLYREIANTVEKEGGWPGTPPTDLMPVIGKPIIQIRPQGKTVFADSVIVSIEALGPVAEIRYTLDDSEPSEKSAIYTGPFELSDSALVQAIAFYGHQEPRTATVRKFVTPVVSAQFVKDANS